MGLSEYSRRAFKILDIRLHRGSSIEEGLASKQLEGRTLVKDVTRGRTYEQIKTLVIGSERLITLIEKPTTEQNLSHFHSPHILTTYDQS
jgi:hypothetical protein